MSSTDQTFTKLPAPKKPGANGDIEFEKLVEAASAWATGSPYGDTPQRVEQIAALAIARGEVALAERLAEVVPESRVSPGKERATKALIWSQIAAGGNEEAHGRARELIEAVDADRASGESRRVELDTLAAAHFILGDFESMEEILQEALQNREEIDRSVAALLAADRLDDAATWFLRQVEATGRPSRSHQTVGTLVGALVAAGEHDRALTVLEGFAEPVRTLVLGQAKGQFQGLDLSILESFAVSPEARVVLARHLLAAGRNEEAVEFFQRGDSNPLRRLVFALDAGDDAAVQRELGSVDPEERPAYLATLRFQAGAIELTEALATIEESAGEHTTSLVESLARLLPHLSSRGDRQGVEQVIHAIDRAWSERGLSSFDKGREASCRAAELAARAAAYLALQEPKLAAKATREARAVAGKASGTSKKVSALQAVAKAEIAMGCPEEAYKTAKKLPKNDRSLMSAQVVRAFLPDDPAGAFLALGLNEVPPSRLQMLVEVIQALPATPRP